MSDIIYRKKLKIWHIFTLFRISLHKMRFFRSCALIVGATVGMGLFSGAEVVRFFVGERFLLAVFLFFIGYSLLVFRALSLGTRYGGFQKTLLSLFKSKSVAVKLLFFFGSFFCLVATLAGLDALLPDLSPFLSLAVGGVAFLFAQRGARGISKLSMLLTPITVLYLWGKGSLLWKGVTLPSMNELGGCALYAGYNAFLSFPVLCEVGKDLKKGEALPLSVCAVAVVALCIICVLGRVQTVEYMQSQLPFFQAIGEAASFLPLCALSAFISLSSAEFSLLSTCDRIKNAKKRNAAKVVSLLAAFALSRLQFTQIIGYFCPIFGVLGLIFSALTVFYDGFLQQNDEKIHTGCQNTQNTGRTHHQIELEHLTAVHD